MISCGFDQLNSYSSNGWMKTPFCLHNAHESFLFLINTSHLASPRSPQMNEVISSPLVCRQKYLVPARHTYIHILYLTDLKGKSTYSLCMHASSERQRDATMPTYSHAYSPVHVRSSGITLAMQLMCGGIISFRMSGRWMVPVRLSTDTYVVVW